MPGSQETSVCLFALSLPPHVIVGTHVSNTVAHLGLGSCPGLAHVALSLSPWKVSSLGSPSGP